MPVSTRKRLGAQEQTGTSPKRRGKNPGKKVKTKGMASEVDTSSETTAEKSKKRVSVEVFFGSVKERIDAVNLVMEVFEKSEEESEAIVNLAATLRPDDPAVFITFARGTDIRNSLLSEFAGVNAAVNRPCLPGNNGNQALENLKTWVRNQLPGTNETVQESTPQGLAIGNLTSDEYSALALALSFNVPPANQWGIANAANQRSLGGLIGVTGTGRGSASIGIMPSNGFLG